MADTVCEVLTISTCVDFFSTGCIDARDNDIFPSRLNACYIRREYRFIDLALLISRFSNDKRPRNIRYIIILRHDTEVDEQEISYFDFRIAWHAVRQC